MLKSIIFSDPRLKKSEYSYRILTLVRLKGLEPTRQKHENLNLACLPIPSQAHIFTVHRCTLKYYTRFYPVRQPYAVHPAAKRFQYRFSLLCYRHKYKSLKLFLPRILCNFIVIFR